MLPRSSLSVLMTVAMISSSAPATAVARATEPDAEADDGSSDQAVADLETTVAEPAVSSSAPVVHIINEKPDADRGFLKLVKYRGETAQASVNTIVVTTHYEELCTEPCAAPIDVSDRPVLFFIRDGKQASNAFRIAAGEPEVTLSVKPLNRPLWTAGVYMSIILVGIPMLVAARPRVSMAAGPPSPSQSFKKVKRVRP
jgi:hypothetical protein